VKKGATLKKLKRNRDVSRKTLKIETLKKVKKEEKGKISHCTIFKQAVGQIGRN